MSNLGTVPGAGQPWKQQYDFNTEVTPSSLTWTAASSLPYTVTRLQAIVTKNRVYLLAGYVNDNESNTVYTAPINADGALGDWTTAMSLPAKTVNSQAIVTKNRVYLISDINKSNDKICLISNPSSIDLFNVVYTAPINEDGTLGNFVIVNYLPVLIYHSQVIVTKNRIYLLGGRTKGSNSSAVYTVSINEDGTLGDWIAADPLPAKISKSQAVVTKNSVYLLSGVINDHEPRKIYNSPINEDGTLGDWTVVGILPAIIIDSQAIVTRNRVFLFGEKTMQNQFSTAYTAPIDKDGIIGKWTTTNPPPERIIFPQAIIVKNKVYLLGGCINDFNFYNSMFVADLPGGLNDYSEFY